MLKVIFEALRSGAQDQVSNLASQRQRRHVDQYFETVAATAKSAPKTAKTLRFAKQRGYVLVSRSTMTAFGAEADSGRMFTASEFAACTRAQP